MEAECPGHVDIPVIENLDGLPYRIGLARWRKHRSACETCATAFEADPENCERYCKTGHDRIHEVADYIQFTHNLSHLN